MILIRILTKKLVRNISNNFFEKIEQNVCMDLYFVKKFCKKIVETLILLNVFKVCKRRLLS